MFNGDIMNTTERQTTIVPPQSKQTKSVIDSFKSYGPSGLITILIVVALIDFARRLGTRAADKIPLGIGKIFKKNLSKDKLEKLKNHLLFQDIENNIKVNIYNLHYSCKLRRLVFIDALTFRMEAEREEILKLIEGDNYFKMTPSEFHNAWKQMESNITASWHNKCYQAGIFHFVIKKMDDAYQDKIQIINNLIDSVYRDNTKEFDIYKKTDTIFDILKAIQYSLMVNTLEDTIAVINGDFSGKTYKNVTCPGKNHCESIQCPIAKMKD